MVGTEDYVPLLTPETIPIRGQHASPEASRCGLPALTDRCARELRRDEVKAHHQLIHFNRRLLTLVPTETSNRRCAGAAESPVHHEVRGSEVQAEREVPEFPPKGPNKID